MKRPVSSEYLRQQSNFTDAKNSYSRAQDSYIDHLETEGLLKDEELHSLRNQVDNYEIVLGKLEAKLSKLRETDWIGISTELNLPEPPPNFNLTPIQNIKFREDFIKVKAYDLIQKELKK